MNPSIFFRRLLNELKQELAPVSLSGKGVTAGDEWKSSWTYKVTNARKRSPLDKGNSSAVDSEPGLLVPERELENQAVKDPGEMGAE